MSEEKKLLLELMASLTLCDHMGDVADDVDYVRKKLGIKADCLDLSDATEFVKELHSMGVKTLYGTSLKERVSFDD